MLLPSHIKQRTRVGGFCSRCKNMKHQQVVASTYLHLFALISNTTTSVLDSTHFDHNNEWVHWTVGTSRDSHPRRHRVPIALTQTLGLTQARPPAVTCVGSSHLAGQPQSKHVRLVPSSSDHHTKKQQNAVARNLTTTTTSALDLSARISITTMNKCR